jgi:hypothetical protein
MRAAFLIVESPLPSVTAHERKSIKYIYAIFRRAPNEFSLFQSHPVAKR